MLASANRNAVFQSKLLLGCTFNQNQYEPNEAEEYDKERVEDIGADCAVNLDSLSVPSCAAVKDLGVIIDFRFVLEGRVNNISRAASSSQTLLG